MDYHFTPIVIKGTKWNLKLQKLQLKDLFTRTQKLLAKTFCATLFFLACSRAWLLITDAAPFATLTFSWHFPKQQDSHANLSFVSRRYWTLWVETLNQTYWSSTPSLPLDRFLASSDNQKQVQDSLFSLCFLQLHLQNPAKKTGKGENSHLPQPTGRQEHTLWWQSGFAFQMLQVWQAAKRRHHTPRGAKASAWA